jgi:hypothetical protein
MVKLKLFCFHVLYYYSSEFENSSRLVPQYENRLKKLVKFEMGCSIKICGILIRVESQEMTFNKNTCVTDLNSTKNILRKNSDEIKHIFSCIRQKIFSQVLRSTRNKKCRLLGTLKSHARMLNCLRFHTLRVHTKFCFRHISAQRNK